MDFHNRHAHHSTPSSFREEPQRLVPTNRFVEIHCQLALDGAVSGRVGPQGGVMVGRSFVRSTVGFAAALGFVGYALVLAQQPAPKPAAPRPTPAVLVMNVNFQPAVAGKTEQLPFVQGNVADPNLELKQ